MMKKMLFFFKYTNINVTHEPNNLNNIIVVEICSLKKENKLMSFYVLSKALRVVSIWIVASCWKFTINY